MFCGRSRLADLVFDLSRRPAERIAYRIMYHQLRFRDLLSVRRRIAHQPVTPKEDRCRIGMRLGEPAPSWYEIHVRQNERLRDSAAKLPPLTIEDSQGHLAAVEKLRDRLAMFFYEVLSGATIKNS
jgi:hypothetical protein